MKSAHRKTMRLFTRLGSGRLRSSKSSKADAPLDPSLVTIEPISAAAADGASPNLQKENDALRSKLDSAEAQVTALRARV